MPLSLLPCQSTSSFVPITSWNFLHIVHLLCFLEAFILKTPSEAQFSLLSDIGHPSSSPWCLHFHGCRLHVFYLKKKKNPQFIYHPLKPRTTVRVSDTLCLCPRKTYIQCPTDTNYVTTSLLEDRSTVSTFGVGLLLLSLKIYTVLIILPDMKK